MEASQRISLALGVEALVMPPKNRDRHYQHMAQLVALAQWADSLASTVSEGPAQTTESEDVGQAVGPEPEPVQEPDYESMTARELRTMAEERGLDHSHARTKAEVIDLLNGVKG